TFAVIHGTVQTASCAPDGLAALAAQNRGITMGSSLRKKPNAFNLLHQARLVSAFGAEKFEKIWQDASQFQTAYQIGEKEAKACFNLLSSVDAAVSAKLMELCTKRSMIRFVTHEPLASGYFNRNFNAGTGVFFSLGRLTHQQHRPGDASPKPHGEGLGRRPSQVEETIPMQRYRALY
ncbi:unnamed protein product, partial [Durusdinium trenchii]